MAEQWVTAGMAWTDIARSAYRAYAAFTGNKNFRGHPMPSWDNLPPRIRYAWEAAVRQAGDCLENPRGEMNEDRWANWQPPCEG